MTTTIVALTLLVIAGAETTDADEKQTPNDAVAAVNVLLAQKDFAAFYDKYCHIHLRNQVTKQAFIEEMSSDRGAAMVRLFADVQAAIKAKKAEDVLIARVQEDADEYEYILVQVRKRPSKGQQWHLEFKREDGKWKLMDTD